MHSFLFCPGMTAAQVGSGSVLARVFRFLCSGHLAWLIIVVLFYEREHLRGQLHSSLVHNEYGSRLAIVVPFIEEELATIESNLQLWSQSPYFPCEAASGAKRHTDLVFYYNQDWARQPQMIPKLQKLLGSSPARHCFRQVRFLMANLPPRSPEDRYPLGSSVMFFRAMELPGLVDDYRYMYWMEADQRPCQAGWLDKIYALAISRPGFWMIGSIVRDGQQSNTYYSFADHINGNALYRLDDPEFHTFLGRVQEEFAKNKGRFLSAFDIAIYLVARHSLTFSEYAAIKHRFHYTQLVQNVYRLQTNATQICTANPDTFLIHGKYLFT